MLIVPYQKSWEKDFLRMKEILEHQLHEVPITIEHVGSTSIRDMAAKPIIDIDLIHQSEDYSVIRSGLEQLGYFHNGDQGIAGREAFKRAPATPHLILDTIKHHLYVCPQHSKELERHLLFRDYLRSDKETREQYKTIKLQLAEEANQDRKVYARLKEVKATEFIESILVKAKKQRI